MPKSPNGNKNGNRSGKRANRWFGKDFSTGTVKPVKKAAKRTSPSKPSSRITKKDDDKERARTLKLIGSLYEKGKGDFVDIRITTLREAGISDETLIGLYTDRKINLVVHDRGPSMPKEQILHMKGDSKSSHDDAWFYRVELWDEPK